MIAPFAFGACAGRLHAAAGDVGIVICPGLAYEQFCTTPSLRDLADRLAQRGYPTLRYDAPGCGDSLGDDREGQRITVWRASIDDACAALRRATGVSRIVLIGARLGGALALEACGRIEGVEALAMIAPVITGRSYRREIVAFAGMTGGPADDRGLVRMAGFAVTPETLAALEGLDATRAAHAPAQVFLAAPAQAPGLDRLTERLQALGAATTRADFAGYEAFMDAPTFSQAPTAMFEALVAWIEVAAPVRSRRESEMRAAPARLVGAHFREEGVAFDEGRLAGVLCAPTQVEARGRALVFVNAGGNPRIGWARQCVDQARALAAEGWMSLRFDVAGLGDSPPRRDRPAEIPYSDAPQADLISALDWLGSRGVEEAIVIGSCSGAHLAFHTALRDRRIVGVAMVNLQAFVWTPGRSLAIAAREAARSTAYYKQQAWRVDTWRRLLRGGVNLRTILRTLARRASARTADRVKAIGAGPLDSVSHKFARLAARGARVMLVYSEGDGGLDELSAHLGVGGRSFLRLPHTRLETIADADHNLTSQAARDRLAELLSSFLREGELGASRSGPALLSAASR